MCDTRGFSQRCPPALCPTPYLDAFPFVSQDCFVCALHTARFVSRAFRAQAKTSIIDRAKLAGGRRACKVGRREALGGRWRVVDKLAGACSAGRYISCVGTCY